MRSNRTDPARTSSFLCAAVGSYSAFLEKYIKEKQYVQERNLDRNDLATFVLADWLEYCSLRHQALNQYFPLNSELLRAFDSAFDRLCKSNNQGFDQLKRIGLLHSGTRLVFSNWHDAGMNYIQGTGIHLLTHLEALRVGDNSSGLLEAVRIVLRWQHRESRLVFESEESQQKDSAKNASQVDSNAQSNAQNQADSDLFPAGKISNKSVESMAKELAKTETAKGELTRGSIANTAREIAKKVKDPDLTGDVLNKQFRAAQNNGQIRYFKGQNPKRKCAKT